MVDDDRIASLGANKCASKNAPKMSCAPKCPVRPKMSLTSELIGRNVREQLEACGRPVNRWGDSVGPTRRPTSLIHLTAGGHKVISRQRHLSVHVLALLGLSHRALPTFRKRPWGPFRGGFPLPLGWRSLTTWSPPTISHRRDKNS